MLTWSNSVWFQVLKDSTRSSSRLPRVSFKTKLLNSDKFQLSRPGPRNELCPALPNAPTAGLTKADVSNHSRNRVRIGDVPDLIRTVRGVRQTVTALAAGELGIDRQAGGERHDSRDFPATQRRFHEVCSSCGAGTECRR